MEFLDYVYRLIGFTYKLELSTRPENYLGELDLWNEAEKRLEEALNQFGKPWKINP